MRLNPGALESNKKLVKKALKFVAKHKRDNYAVDVLKPNESGIYKKVFELQANTKKRLLKSIDNVKKRNNFVPKFGKIRKI